MPQCMRPHPKNAVTPHFLAGLRSPDTLYAAPPNMPVSWLPRPIAAPSPPNPLLGAAAAAPAAAAPLLPVSLLLVAPLCSGLLKPPVKLLPAGLLPGALAPPLFKPRPKPGPLQLTALAAGRTPAANEQHSREKRAAASRSMPKCQGCKWMRKAVQAWHKGVCCKHRCPCKACASAY